MVQLVRNSFALRLLVKFSQVDAALAGTLHALGCRRQQPALLHPRTLLLELRLRCKSSCITVSKKAHSRSFKSKLGNVKCTLENKVPFNPLLYTLLLSSLLSLDLV